MRESMMIDWKRRCELGWDRKKHLVSCKSKIAAVTTSDTLHVVQLAFRLLSGRGNEHETTQTRDQPSCICVIFVCRQ